MVTVSELLKTTAITAAIDEKGNVVPATLVLAGPITVTQIKTKEPLDKTRGKKDGYDAVQIGFGTRKIKNIKKPQRKAGAFRYLREFRISEEDKDFFKKGDKIDVSVFEEGNKVEVSGISKGKGFQGVVKRHGFHGGPRSHGQKHSEREPGSIGGAGRAGGRVAKGMRMAGRMGSDRITVKNLKVIAVDTEKNQIFVEGAVPGRRGTLIELKVK